MQTVKITCRLARQPYKIRAMMVTIPAITGVLSTLKSRVRWVKKVVNPPVWWALTKLRIAVSL